MIGRIRFEWAGETLSAELSDDLKWSCDHAVYGADLARWLGVLFDPLEDLSPSRGAPGFAALDRAAEWLEAELTWGPAPEGESERDGIF